jgi:hypothetical protein
MSNAPESVSAGGRVAFQVEHVDLDRAGRCAVQGRWTGVRGRRFMRPALTVIVGGQRVRLLADLEHKPWAAEDGEPWMAEFPCEFAAAAVEEAELTVAPDITVLLPLDGKAGSRGKRGRSGPVAQAKARSPVAAGQSGLRTPEQAGMSSSLGGTRQSEPSRSQVTQLQDERRRLREEVARLAEESAAAEARATELSAQLERLTQERNQLVEERDEATARCEEARVARSRMSAELESAHRERAAAQESGEAAREASDRFLNERGAALAAQARAESDRDAAIAARDQALAERDAAVAVRDHALAERNAATAARDQVLSDRDKLARSNDRLQTELADQISARRGAALVIRRAAQDPPASRPFALLIPRVITLLVVVVIALVVLALLKVI